MKKKMARGIFGIVMLVVMTVAAAQNAVSVNITNVTTPFVLDAGDITGVRPSGNWNNTDILGGSTAVPLVASDGSSAGSVIISPHGQPTGVYANANSNNVSFPSDVQKLFGWRCRDNGCTAEFSGIPFAYYDVYVYLGFADFSGNVNISINDGPGATYLWNEKNLSQISGFVESKTNVKGNYVAFRELSGSDLKVRTSNGLKGWCCGYQIVEVPTISMTGPENNAQFDINVPITLSARVVREAHVEQVEFFREIEQGGVVSMGIVTTGDGNGHFSVSFDSLPELEYVVFAEVSYDDAPAVQSGPVTFTVLPLNDPPYNVDAGDGQYAFLTDGEAQVNLSGSYSDDGLSPVSVTWSEDERNPEGAVFVGDVNSVNATVAFNGSIPNGTQFTFHFTVDDGKNAPVSDEVVITVFDLPDIFYQNPVSVADFNVSGNGNATNIPNGVQIDGDGGLVTISRSFPAQRDPFLIRFTLRHASGNNGRIFLKANGQKMFEFVLTTRNWDWRDNRTDVKSGIMFVGPHPRTTWNYIRWDGNFSKNQFYTFDLIVDPRKNNFDLVFENGEVYENLAMYEDLGFLDEIQFQAASGSNNVHQIGELMITTIDSYTITPSPGANGAIYPRDPLVAAEGSREAYKIKPDEGYMIEDVLVDGVSQGPIALYRFNNIDADHTISATFIPFDQTTASDVPAVVEEGTSVLILAPNRQIRNYIDDALEGLVAHYPAAPVGLYIETYAYNNVADGSGNNTKDGYLLYKFYDGRPNDNPTANNALLDKIDEREWDYIIPFESLGSVQQVMQFNEFRSSSAVVKSPQLHYPEPYFETLLLIYRQAQYRVGAKLFSPMIWDEQASSHYNGNNVQIADHVYRMSNSLRLPVLPIAFALEYLELGGYPLEPDTLDRIDEETAYVIAAQIFAQLFGDSPANSSYIDPDLDAAFQNAAKSNAWIAHLAHKNTEHYSGDYSGTSTPANLSGNISGQENGTSTRHLVTDDLQNVDDYDPDNNFGGGGNDYIWNQDKGESFENRRNLIRGKNGNPLFIPYARHHSGFQDLKVTPNTRKIYGQNWLVINHYTGAGPTSDAQYDPADDFQGRADQTMACWMRAWHLRPDYNLNERSEYDPDSGHPAAAACAMGNAALYSLVTGKDSSRFGDWDAWDGGGNRQANFDTRQFRRLGHEVIMQMGYLDFNQPYDHVEPAGFEMPFMVETDVTIAQQPTDQVVEEGKTAKFTVVAGGNSSVSYQWRKDDVDLGNGGRINGANSATLTISNVSVADMAFYSVVLTGPFNSVESEAASLTVAVLPDISIESPAVRNVNLPSAANVLKLKASVSHDIPVTTMWSQASGPGAAEFDDPCALETAVGFDTAGLYVITLTADDGTYQSHETLTVTVGDVDVNFIPPTSGLLGLWQLNEVVGPEATDASPAGHTGTAEGGYAWSPEMGIEEGAISLDGSGKVTVPNIEGINSGGPFVSRTLSLWFKADNVGLNQKQLLVEQGGGSNGFNLYLYNGSLYGGKWGNGDDWISTNAVTSGQWHHACLTMADAGGGNVTITLYLNGNAVGSRTLGNLPDHGDGNGFGGVNSDTRYHDGVNSGVDYFSGMIDLVAFHERSLTQEEIKALVAGKNSVTVPAVDAGEDVTMTLGEGLNLSGSVTAGDTAVSATLWDLKTGPAAPWFADSGALATGVTFPLHGLYVLQLVATDANATVYDRLVCQVFAVGDLTQDGVIDLDDVKVLSDGWQSLYDISDLEDLTQDWLK